MTAKETRFTARLVLSQAEAYVAIAERREPRGPNGEAGIARLLHTTDAGASWLTISWKLHFLSRVRYPFYPTWPPEAIIDMQFDERGLAITHRDEWVPFEPGGESLWRSYFNGSAWIPKKLRAMNYERKDSPAAIAEIALSLPSTIQAPRTNRGQTP